MYRLSGNDIKKFKYEINTAHFLMHFTVEVNWTTKWVPGEIH